MLDPALRAFVDATEEGDADRHLEIALEGITPRIRSIAARKLSPRDLDDVVGDALLLLVRRLRSLRAVGEADVIEDLEGYAAAVVHSLCAQLYRLRHPRRSRLKNRIRYVLGSDPRFALWDVPGRGLHCGLAEWRSETPSSSAGAEIDGLIRNPSLWPSSWTPSSFSDRDDLAPLVRDIIDRVGGPVELEDLVNLIASVWRIDRIPAEESPISVDGLAAPEDSAFEEALDRKRFAERLWAEIQELPLRQRTALLLNLRDRRGAGMLWVFPAIGVASLRAIAASLELSFEEFAGLWQRLPIDDQTIAARLGCERQQVINLRMAAKKRLSNRLGTPEAPRPFDSSARDNLGRVSASLAGES